MEDDASRDSSLTGYPAGRGGRRNCAWGEDGCIGLRRGRAPAAGALRVETQMVVPHIPIHQSGERHDTVAGVASNVVVSTVATQEQRPPERGFHRAGLQILDRGSGVGCGR
jgi:hypothetical protein